MRKFTLLFSVVIAVVLSTVNVYGQSSKPWLETDPNAASISTPVIATIGGPEAIWDMHVNLNIDSITFGQGLAGSEYDGLYFWAAEWGYTPAGGTVQKHIFRVTKLGAVVDSFPASWTGTSTGMRDLAWDGQYMYGSNASSTIYCFSGAGVLINSITSPVAVRAIAYDAVSNGFWVNNWSTDFTLVSRQGNILNVIIPTSGNSNYGLAWDGTSANGPYLWAFTGGASVGDTVKQYKISNGTYTGLWHNVGADLGVPTTGLCGGLFTGLNIVAGKFTLGGIDQATGTLFGYDLDAVVGVPETQAKANVKVYPNPASTSIQVTAGSRIDRISLLSLNGQTVFTTVVGTETASINTESLSKGVYFVKIETENGTTLEKVTIR